MYTPDNKQIEITELTIKVDSLERKLANKTMEYDNLLAYNNTTTNILGKYEKQNDALIEAICLLAKAR